MYVCMYVCYGYGFVYVCMYVWYGFMAFDDTVIILRCTRGIVVKASGLKGNDHEFDAWVVGIAKG